MPFRWESRSYRSNVYLYLFPNIFLLRSDLRHAHAHRDSVSCESEKSLVVGSIQSERDLLRLLDLPKLNKC